MNKPERVIYTIDNVTEKNALKLIYKNGKYNDIYDESPREVYEYGDEIVYKYEYPIFYNAKIKLIKGEYYLEYCDRLICKIDTFDEKSKKIIANDYDCIFTFGGGVYKTVIESNNRYRFSKPEQDTFYVIVEITERL